MSGVLFTRGRVSGALGTRFPLLRAAQVLSATGGDWSCAGETEITCTHSGFISAGGSASEVAVRVQTLPDAHGSLTVVADVRTRDDGNAANDTPHLTGSVWRQLFLPFIAP